MISAPVVVVTVAAVVGVVYASMSTVPVADEA